MESVTRTTLTSALKRCIFSHLEFNAAEFIRRLEAGEFDKTLRNEIDQLSEYEIEELAFLLTGRLRANAAGTN